jgi:hypothetical protein
VGRAAPVVEDVVKQLRLTKFVHQLAEHSCSSGTRL